MKRLYLRWTVLLLIFGVIGFLGFSRYNREVRTISPREVLNQPADTGIRLMGMIDAGGFQRGSNETPFRFTLSAEGSKVAVVFSGDDEDTLRELKTIVVVGRWDREKNEFDATEIALVPNYGFITSAYLLSLIPLAFFLFQMERRVALLYAMIKEEKIYQAEEGF